MNNQITMKLNADPLIIQALKEDITSEDIINIYDALKDNIETLHVNDKLAEDIKNGKHLPFETKIDRLFVCSEKNEPIAIIERDHGKIFKVVRGLF